MNWKKATNEQLIVIAYHEPAVDLTTRIKAGKELKRRARRRVEDRTQYKLKAVYHR